ncbi:MAG: DMT family transporter [Clostridiales bacterium]|nr:DMT family transporter [Clostridiales bacterium]
MTDGKNRTRPGAWLLVAAAAVIWGTMGIWVRRLRGYGLGTMDIIAVRSLGNTIVMGGFLLFYDRSQLKIQKKDLWCFLGTGIASILFFNYCYFKSVEMLDLATAAVLLYTSPIFVVLISAVCFRERLTWQKCAAVAMAVIGCALVSGLGSVGSSLHAAGLTTGLGAGLGYALYSIFSRFALERGYRTLTITFYTFLIAGVCLIPFLVPRCAGGEIAAQVVSSPEFWLLIAGLVVIATTAAYLLYTVGLSQMDNTRAAVIATVEPVTAALIGVFLYHESMDGKKLVGVLIVLLSGWLVGRG